MSLLAELKRRNVIKVAAAYVIVGWLIMQAGDVMAPALNLPDWVNSTLAFFLILGFPVALIFAWAFELTPEGLKLDKDVDRSQSIAPQTGRKLDFMIIALLAVALVYFIWEARFSGTDDAAGTDAVTINETKAEAGPEAPNGTAAVVQTGATDAGLLEDKSKPADDMSIAVLPFVNMSSDEEQEYFSDGLSEELLNLLAKIPELRVAARTSSFSFKGQNLEIPEIASRLGVAHVLEGSVRKAGNQLRITAQLIHAEDGFHLWSETYDRQMENIFQIQDEIAAHVVEELAETLLGQQPKVAQADPEAYRLYLEGKFQFNKRAEESIRRAKQLLEQSVAIDPGYAPAWAELAYASLWLSSSVADEHEIDDLQALGDLAISAALQADPNLAMAYFTRGAKKMYRDRNIVGGIEDYETAYRLEPGSAFITATLGTGNRVLGQFDQAAGFYQKSIQLDPLLPEVHNLLAITYYHQARFDAAADAFRKTLELSPEFVGTHARLARTLLQLGQPAQALELSEKEPADVYLLMAQAMAHDALGDRQRSDEFLNELIEQYGNLGAFQVAEVYGYREQTDKTFEWVERAIENGDSGLLSSLGNRAFDGLLKDPRWPGLLKKIGLYEAWLEMPPEWGGPQS